MPKKNSPSHPQVEPYFTQGCGRCPLGGTPDCKVLRWPKELKILRRILLESGLREELKWGIPCYTTATGGNVVLLSALKESCVLSFPKGVLLTDPQGLLEKPGENTRAGRVLRFTSAGRILELESYLKELIQEATHIEESGQKVELDDALGPLPEELIEALDQSLDLKQAFQGLTPGRQRGYVLHIAGAKQPKTRRSRIEKVRQKILDGKGFHDR